MIDYKTKHDNLQYQVPYWITKLEEIIDSVKQQAPHNYFPQEKYQVYKEKGR